MEELLKEILEEQKKIRELLQVIVSNKEQFIDINSLNLSLLSKQISEEATRIHRITPKG